ncbi:hypothetical protein AYO20_09726 [Fonsecaea nubica]|uniref:SET domain-containing protein n=1 Tax=Fonsecaea nubica TaxID=856822 RepID=A0A178CF39_9EURO|nr:hypothetical protein AYO20_09726 [Fonsecaea nubica]OAL27653.1 hypothetical protein AYO20_09726 [Fonsecaea nubica]
MNTHDVSDVPQYFEFLRRQRQSLQEAQSRKGQRPQARRSREEITVRFRFSLMMGTAGPGSYDKFNLRSSFIPPAYPPCTSALAELKKTMIKDLLLETHHRGTYLLLRSITPPAKMNAIMTIVEDESQDVVMLQLYYQEGENDCKIEDIAGEGTILIVREPYFKLMSDGEYGLRVDHLSDVTYLPAYDQRVPNHWQKDIIVGSASVDDWKIKGNDFYRGSKYRAAIECYTKALDCSPTEDKSGTIKINRALAYIKTKQFEAALFDLEYETFPQKPNEKALFSKALALYHLQRYRECREVLKTVLVNYPEQESGKYNLKGLQTEAAKLRPPQLDHATFSGPVAIRTSNGRGRGLFTTRAVKAGELLLCEKAFAYAFDDSQKATAGGNSTILINAETNSITIGAQAELIQLIVQKMYRNPSSATTITNLHHGSYQPVKITEVDGTPIPRYTHHKLELLRMSTLVSRDPSTSFGGRSFIGDMMLVRATQDLAADTEITFWYHLPGVNDYDERRKKFQHWGFMCDCAMCQDEKATKKSVWAKRTKLRADVLKHFKSDSKANIPQIETVLAELVATYPRPASDVPRLSVWDVHLGLAKMCLAHRQPVQAVESGVSALESLGYVIEGGRLPHILGTPLVVKKWGLMQDHLVECWMVLARAYSLVAPDLEVLAIEYARTSYKICVGEDDSFDETYGRIFRGD